MHYFSSGGGSFYGGYDALNHMLIIHGNAGKLGEYPILSKLPDKFARFLHEFHDFHFQRMNLPPLPADRSNFDVHAALAPDQVIIIPCPTILTPPFHPITVMLIVNIVITVIIVIITIICLPGTFTPSYSGNANNTSAPGPLCPLQLYDFVTHKIRRCTAYPL